MKYEKGSFIVIPNKTLLHSLSAGALAIYVHLCDFADENGVCFPSRRVLAERIDMHINSVDRFLDELIKADMLEKVTRHRKDGSITSNEYQIMVVPLTTHSGSPTTTHSGAEQYPVLTNLSVEKPRTVVQDTSDLDGQSPEKPPKKVTPEMNIVFNLMGGSKKALQWQVRPIERQAAQILYDTFAEKLGTRWNAYQKVRHEPMCPQVDKPSEFLDKMPKIERFMTQK